MAKHKERIMLISPAPNLSLEFHVADGLIHKIDLRMNGRKGLMAQIHSTQPNPKVEELVESWLNLYSQGSKPGFELPINLKGLPPYTYRVLTALGGIPFGKAISYKDLAANTGKPLGARAAGNACARNPLPLIIPCHRVLASDGSIGGYSGGLDVKKMLLEFEGILCA